jgi:hypothetical protein
MTFVVGTVFPTENFYGAGKGIFAIEGEGREVGDWV